MMVTAAWAAALAVCGVAGDSPQLGRSPLRNNVVETGSVPTEWDVKTGHNIKWSRPLGSSTFGSPVIADGKIFVGTNNQHGYLRRYPAKVDLGVLLCFRESDGEFLWQHSSEKLPSGRVHDWPSVGIGSTPIVEGDRLWYVTNRGEVVCLDTEGFLDDEDDGPFLGVFTRPFEIIGNLNALKQGGISFEAAETLRPILELAGIKAAAGLHYRQIGGSSSWQATTSVQKTGVEVLQLDVGDSTLTISGRGSHAGKGMELDLDLFEGLDEGRLSPALQVQFTSRGFKLPDGHAVQVLQAGTSWSVLAAWQGATAEVQLDRQGDFLQCRQKVESIQKDEADIVWSFDMMRELGVRQHNLANCSPTIWGDMLFVCTSNGVDESHANIPAPDAPSFLALDKRTGQVLWTDNSPGRNILHGQWSSPAVGVFDGVAQVLFAGGDGWLYSFRADRGANGKPEFLWKFDGNAKNSTYSVSGHKSSRNHIIAPPVIYDGLVYLAMGEDPDHGEGSGDLWCIAPTRQGDVSPELVVDPAGHPIPHQRVQATAPIGDMQPIAVPNPNSAVVWHYKGHDLDGNGRIEFEEEFHRCIGGPAIRDDLLFIADCSGLVHCVNTKTGVPCWTADVTSTVWGGTLIVGNQVIVGDEDGDVALLTVSIDPTRSLVPIGRGLSGTPQREMSVGDSILSTPAFANGVLYVATRARLLAISAEK